MVYNWWTIFMRLGIPDKHAEAITSRPLALHGIARQTRHGNQTTVEITSTHAKASQIAEILTKVSGFLKRIKATAEQLTQRERWKLILSAAFRHFLGGRRCQEFCVNGFRLVDDFQLHWLHLSGG